VEGEGLGRGEAGSARCTTPGSLKDSPLRFVNGFSAQVR